MTHWEYKPITVVDAETRLCCGLLQRRASNTDDMFAVVDCTHSWIWRGYARAAVAAVIPYGEFHSGTHLAVVYDIAKCIVDGIPIPETFNVEGTRLRLARYEMEMGDGD